MAQARQAERTLPQAAFLLPVTLAAALVIGLVAAFAMIASPGIDFGALGNETSPSVIQSGQAWQAQHEQQSVYANAAVTRSGQDWQAQREQQSFFGNAVTQSGLDWEMQRQQQSGYSNTVIQSGQDWEAQREQQSGITPR